MKLKDRIFYGWIVTAAFFAIGTMVWGIRFSYGVFFKSIEGEFNLSRAATSSVFSAHMALGIVVAIVGGWALDRFGPKIVTFIMGLLIFFSMLLTSQTNSLWHLYMGYSVLLSMGGSANYVVITSTISRWFDKKRGTALGIASSGVGLGTVVMAPIATFLITSSNWRIAFLVMGVISVVIILPLSWLLKAEPRDVGALPDGTKPASAGPLGENSLTKHQNDQPVDFSPRQAFKTRSFWLIMFVYFAIAFALFLVSTHLVPHATDIGISAKSAATILSMLGIATVIGRISMGAISDKIGRKASIVISALLEIVALLGLIWARDLWTLYLSALAFGFAYGGVGPCIAAIIGETFGLRRIGTLMGLMDIGFGIGAAVGPAIGGLIFDASKSYTVAFLLAAVIMLIGTLSITLTKREIIRNAGLGSCK